MYDRVLRFIWLALALAAVLPLGCADAPQPVALQGPAVAPAADYTELGAVLAAAVDQDGSLHPEALEPLHEGLNVQLSRLAATGPTATPLLLTEPEDRLAYWYNARCAWSIELTRLQRTYGAEAATLITALLPHVRGAALRRLQDAIGYRAIEAPREETLAIVAPDGAGD